MNECIMFYTLFDHFLGWKKGKKCGLGTFIWENGDKFEGEWLNGDRNGYGVVFGGLFSS